MANKLTPKGKKKKGQRITIIVLLVIIVLAVAVAVTAVIMGLSASDGASDSISSSDSQSVSDSSDVTDSSSSESTSSNAAYSAVGESAAVSDSYFDDAVFIGDSLTVGLGLYGVLPAENVYADTGLNLDTILTKQCIQTTSGTATVLDALKIKKPNKVYIMLGSNGIAWITPENLTAKFAAFLAEVKKILPDATIYVESIFPVTAEKQAGDNRYNNDIIKQYNTLLFDLAETEKVYFLDCHAAFINESGALKSEYAEADGMHLKKTGYDALLEYFKTHTAK